ncbi:MAG: Periplasmic divalent cation tolerance protein CutA [Nitrospira sp.]|nr:MAG: Periplasmic divalent cation tolerance protein CutA [Nitrospira sp.]
MFVTTSSVGEAERIGQVVVNSRLAACANILQGVRSIFRWNNKVNVESECLIIMKTTLDRFSDLEAAIRQHHSYSVPEIIALPIIAGSIPYLEWITGETRK